MMADVTEPLTRNRVSMLLPTANDFPQSSRRLSRRAVVAALVLFVAGCGGPPRAVDDGSTPPAKDVKLLIEQLQKKGPSNTAIRNVAAKRLGRLGPDAAEALPALQEAAKKDPSAVVRGTAAESVKLISGGQ